MGMEMTDEIFFETLEEAEQYIIKLKEKNKEKKHIHEWSCISEY
jgi:hypothetical protein